MDNDVSRTTFRERYGILLRYLQNKIKSGEWPPGEYLPSENELAQSFQLSRPSVRKVLGELSEEGLVQTLHGKGSVVNDWHEAITVLNLFWGMPSFEFEAVCQLVERFNQSNKRIRVEIIPLPSEAMSAAMREGLFMGKNKPDLIGLTNTFFFSLTRDEPEKLLRPLELTEPDDFYAPYVRAFAHKTELLAAPITFAPIVMVYNKTMFDAANLDAPDESWTWEQLLEAAQILTRNAGQQAECYGFCFSASSNRWPLFVLQNGGVFADRGELLPDDPRTRKALEYAVDLIYKHEVSPSFSIGNSRLGEELFLRQKVGMILTSSIYLKNFQDVGFEWEIVRFPGSVPNAGLGLATGIGISSHCTSVEAAKQFIEYVTSESAQAYMKANACSIPARRSVAISRKFPHVSLAGENYYMFEQITEDARTIKDLGLTPQQFYEMNNELNLLWANLESMDTVWNTLRQKWSGN